MIKKIEMRNSDGVLSIAYQGFSFTSLFFGAFPALFRGHFTGFLLLLLLYSAIVGVTFFGVLKLGLPRPCVSAASMLVHVLFGMVYNRYHFMWLERQGFQPTGRNDLE